MYQFKVKHSKIKPDILCLGNISNDFTINNMRKTGLNGVLKAFPLGYNAIENKNILDIHKYLMKEK